MAPKTKFNHNRGKNSQIHVQNDMVENNEVVFSNKERPESQHDEQEKVWEPNAGSQSQQGNRNPRRRNAQYEVVEIFVQIARSVSWTNCTFWVSKTNKGMKTSELCPHDGAIARCHDEATKLVGPTE